MSGKSLALLTAGAGTVTVSFGGVYLFGGNGTGEENGAQADSRPEGGGTESSSPATGSSVNSAGGVDGASSQDIAQTPTPAAKELKFSTLEEFKSKKGYKCSSSTDMFPDNLAWNDSSEIGDLSNSNPDESSYFGDPASDTNKIKSCLIINWEKTTYTAQQVQGGEDSAAAAGDKWKGTFTWTWSFINDNKGFISVGIATTSAGQLDLTGGTYLLEKQQSGSEWGIKYKKEVTSGDKKITVSEFDSKFPKVKADSGVSSEGGDFWGFASKNGDLEEKLCGGNDTCPANPKKTEIEVELEEFKWTYDKNGGGKKIFEWTETWEWWKLMYGSDSFDLKSRLDNFKGNWSKVEG